MYHLFADCTLHLPNLHQIVVFISDFVAGIEGIVLLQEFPLFVNVSLLLLLAINDRGCPRVGPLNVARVEDVASREAHLCARVYVAHLERVTDELERGSGRGRLLRDLVLGVERVAGTFGFAEDLHFGLGEAAVDVRDVVGSVHEVELAFGQVDDVSHVHGGHVAGGHLLLALQGGAFDVAVLVGLVELVDLLVVLLVVGALDGR